MRWFLLCLCCAYGLSLRAWGADSPARPNLIVILADDLGYGDLHSNNPQLGKIQTPHLDRLASEGMRFTDAHSSSAVCSPSRYSLLTGRYHWRTRLQHGIVGVWGEPLIAPDRLTIGKLVQQQGYHTACIGKWHLGFDWPITAADARHVRGFGLENNQRRCLITEVSPETRQVWQRLFSQPFAGGPITRGFDTYFGVDLPNWPPFCFLEQDHTVGIPSELLSAEQMVRNQASVQGPAVTGWRLDAVLPKLGQRACEYIQTRASTKQPFLLYLPLTSPHTPIAVAAEWKGRSGLNPYADFVMQTDAVVGQVLTAVDQAGLRNETVVVVTSDNGCARYIGVEDLERQGHFPSGGLHGYKTDAWEGGHRVPFIVRYPPLIKPGSLAHQTICSVDLLATFAELLQVTLPANAGEDSVSLLPVWRGQEQPVHDAVVHQSYYGVLAIRSGPWKLIFGPGQGDITTPVPPHLYHLGQDLAETHDLAPKHPEIVQRLTAQMQHLIAEGRSTPGPRQANDVPVVLHKQKSLGPLTYSRLGTPFLDADRVDRTNLPQECQRLLRKQP